MKLAILMPAYNSARFIETALASLLRQRDAAQLDIIVADDGSTDGTPEIVGRVASEASEIRLIVCEHRGISATRNAAIDAIAPDTDLVSLLDSDDLSPPGRFARDVERFEKDRSLEFLYGYARYFYRIADSGLEPEPGAPIMDVRGVHLGASMMRLSLLQRIGRFNEAFAQGEDTDFLFRMFDLAPPPVISLTSDVCVYYRQHDANTTGDFDAMLKALARVIAARVVRVRRGEAGAIPRGFFADLDRFRTTPDWKLERRELR